MSGTRRTCEIIMVTNFLSNLINSFKRSMKVNYIIALVQNISPKLVLTNVANSTDFHIVSKALENTKIKFLAIQAADLTGS